MDFWVGLSYTQNSILYRFQYDYKFTASNKQKKFRRRLDLNSGRPHLTETHRTLRTTDPNSSHKFTTAQHDERFNNEMRMETVIVKVDRKITKSITMPRMARVPGSIPGDGGVHSKLWNLLNVLRNRIVDNFDSAYCLKFLER